MPTHAVIQSNRLHHTKRSFIGQLTCIKFSLALVNVQYYRVLQKIMIKQVCFVFAAALVFYSHVSSAASPAGEELVSLLVCRTCDGIFPRSACLESQEIQSTCLQKILEEEELFSQISKRRGFIGKRGARLQKRRGFIG